MSQLTLDGSPRTAARPFNTLRVDHDAIARNIRLIAARAGTDIMAVVKADAFGHGAVQVSRTALAAGATWLGVATIDEALELRSAGITAPVFAWLIDEWCDLDGAILADVTLSCANVSTLDALAAASDRVGVIPRLHPELDSGMSRGGSSPDDWVELCARAAVLERAGAIEVSGVWSHLATASDPGSYAVQQAQDALIHSIGTAFGEGLRPTEFHLANSAGALAHSVPGMTKVRAGAGIYGIEVVDDRTYGLEPAMTVTSRISQLRTVSAGTPVGYNRSYVTTRAATLALVPIGYADGVPRALSNRGCVAVNGVRCPIRGIVSMDQLIVDVTHADAQLGDDVLVLGNGQDGALTASEWARIAATIPHEILTGFGRRITREDQE